MRSPIATALGLVLALPLALLGLSSMTATNPRAATPEIRLPAPEVEMLPNGLEVIWFQNDKLPLVDLALVLKSGSRDDPAGKSGMTELLAKVLDRGPEIEALGAFHYTAPDEEFFTLGLHGLAPDAPVLLKLLAKMAIHPDLTGPEFNRQHASILDHWSHIGDTGESLVSLAFRRQTTAATPYGRGALVSAEEFRKITPADLVNFHKSQFTPKNASLVIVGRADRVALRPQLLESFGSWTGEAPPRTAKVFSDKRIPPAKTGQVLIVNRPELNQTQVRIGFRAPKFNHPDQYALAVINALFGEYFDSRLNSVIRDKLGLTYAIGSNFSYNRELGIFSIAAATRNVTTGPLIRKVLDALKSLRTAPIGDQEIETAKEYLMGGFPLGTATLGAIASRWTVGHVMGLDPDFLNQFVPKIHALTRIEIEAALKKHFNPDLIYVVVAGDAKQIKASLAGQGGFSSRVVSQKDLF